MTRRENPYAAPKVAAQVEVVPERVTMRMRWFFIVMFSISAAYQLLIGVEGIKAGYFPDAARLAAHPDPNDRYWMLSRFIAPCFVVAGVMALRVVWSLIRRRWSRWVFWTGLLVALMTWVPFTILNAVPVSLWIFKRPGRGGDVEGARERGRGRGRKSRVAMPPDEEVRVLKTEAMIRFGIREDQFGVSLARGLRFAPGEVAGFLEDMEVDHGIRLVDAVNASTVSVQEMVEALSRRRDDSNR